VQHMHNVVGQPLDVRAAHVIYAFSSTRRTFHGTGHPTA
jgi:hypothetical protein